MVTPHATVSPKFPALKSAVKAATRSWQVVRQPVFGSSTDKQSKPMMALRKNFGPTCFPTLALLGAMGGRLVEGSRRFVADVCLSTNTQHVFCFAWVFYY
jgi:hypothetical protein